MSDSDEDERGYGGGVKNRLSQLNQARMSWQSRVSKDDLEEAAKLTVGSRVKRSGSSVGSNTEQNSSAFAISPDSRTALKSRMRTLNKRGCSFTKKEREAMYRLLLSTEPIQLENKSGIKRPNAPWLSSDISSLGESIQSKAPQTVEVEVEIFDPSESLALSSFFDNTMCPVVFQHFSTDSQGVKLDINDNVLVPENTSSEKVDSETTRSPESVIDLPSVAEPQLTTRTKKLRAPPRKRNESSKVVLSENCARRNYIERRVTSPISSNVTATHVEGYSPAQRQKILSQAAIQGLASSENFGAVKLEKMEATKERHEKSVLNPFNNVMLIMVKGRYSLQVRLVEPSIKSLNECDCFVLITKREVFVWKGALSNIVEQNRAMEIAKLVVDRKDMGCSATNFDVIYNRSLIDSQSDKPENTSEIKTKEDDNQLEVKKRFLHILAQASSSSEDVEKIASADADLLLAMTNKVSEDPELEDIWYEDCIIATNKVYKVEVFQSDTSPTSAKDDELTSKPSGFSNVDSIDARLVPLVEHSCCSLSHDLLVQHRHTSLVFDFGSELYIWFGKDASPDNRSIAPLLLNQLYNSGYDYIAPSSQTNENLILCPLYPLDDTSPLKSESRPSWTICGKVNQNMETILFAQKFSTWPEKNFISQIRNSKSFEKKSEERASLKEIDNYDFRELLVVKDDVAEGYVVAGVNVGRGHYWKDPIELRAHDVITTSVKYWQSAKGELEECVDYSPKQQVAALFSDDETVIIQWSFYTEIASIKKLQLAGSVRASTILRTSAPNTQKVVYFFWQGLDVTPLDLGACALKVIDLAAEGGENQIRVSQYEEPASFLRLFQGNLIIQSSVAIKQRLKYKHIDWRLFYVQGSFDEERHLVELCLVLNENNLDEKYVLRPYLCYIAMSVSTPSIYIINGPLCNQNDTAYAKKQTNLFDCLRTQSINKDEKSTIVNQVHQVSWSELENIEPTEDSKAGSLASLHNLLAHIPKNYFEVDVSVFKRLILLTSVINKWGNFSFKEIYSPFHSVSSPCTLPFRQTQLYNQIQPAFVLFDCGSVLFLWQGPVDAMMTSSDNGDGDYAPLKSPTSPVTGFFSSNATNSSQGSFVRRFIAEREQALHTAVRYSQAKNITSDKCYYVEAGKESLSFKLLFPFWFCYDHTQMEPALNDVDESNLCTVSAKIAELESLVFPYERLTARPLPSDVDPLKVEQYLSDEEFQEVLGVTRDEFNQFPNWRKIEMKKKVRLI